MVLSRCRLMAQSGHPDGAEECLLSGGKRTSPFDYAAAANDPSRRASVFSTHGLFTPTKSRMANISPAPARTFLDTVSSRNSPLLAPLLRLALDGEPRGFETMPYSQAGSASGRLSGHPPRTAGA